MLKDILLPRKIYNSPEHKMMREMIVEFIDSDMLPFQEEWENNQMVPRELWTKAGSLGLLCLDMPEKYGGSGLDFSFSALFIEELGKKGISGPGFFLHSDIVAPYLLKYGTEDQRSKYLPLMASGQIITAIGMTEPNCGSDLQAIKTTAQDCGDHYLVNGQKTFITNGFMCDMVIVAVKTNKNTENEGVSLLIMDVNAEGFAKGNPLKKIGMKSQDTAELFFDNVKVPKENLLGEEGKGFYIMMSELARERLTVAITAVATTQGAIESTIDYTNERSAFGTSISSFQNTQFKLVECATKLQLHQSFLDSSIEHLMNETLSAEIASMIKFSASDMCGEVVDECLQLFGGYGYMWEYPISRMFVDNRVARIYAGTNEIMKVIVARRLFRK